MDFSAIPQWKESPDYGAEYAELLNRHRILLNELIPSELSEPDEPLLVFTRSWSGNPTPVPRSRWLDRLVPATYFASMTVDPPDGEEDHADWAHLYVSELRVGDPSLASLFLLLAGEAAPEAVIAPRSAAWLYRPYAGGATIWGIPAERAEEFKEKYADWIWPAQVFREPERPDFDAMTDPPPVPGWQFESWDMPEASARRLLEVAEAENLLLSNGHVLDPRDTLTLQLSRADAQLIRVALKRKKGDYFDTFDGTMKTVSPKQAVQRLKEVTSIVESITDFVDDYGYRKPGESVAGRLEARHRDARFDYTDLKP